MGDMRKNMVFSQRNLGSNMLFSVLVCDLDK